MDLSLKQNNDTNTLNSISFVGSILGVVDQDISSEYDVLLSVEVLRKSDKKDIALVYVGKDCIVNDEYDNYTEDTMFKIQGTIISQKKTETSKNGKLIVIAKSLKKIDDEEDNDKTLNEVSLTGYICKYPVHRYTAKGNMISNIVLKVYRDKRKTKCDYIPIIFFGSCIEVIKKTNIGSYVTVKGRLQSRDFFNKKTDTVMTAYEVSGYSITVLEDACSISGGQTDVG